MFYYHRGKNVQGKIKRRPWEKLQFDSSKMKSCIAELNPHNMKTTLLTLILTIIALSSSARSFPKDTLRGKNASYHREFILSAIKMRNIQNKDTSSFVYFDDGKQVSEEYWPTSEPKFNSKYPMEVFKDFLTPQEQDQLKTERGILGLLVVLDKNGNIIEIEFTFSKKNPVLSQFSADRFFELETKFKKLLKWDIDNNDKKIKHLKFLLAISISESARM
ncbi:hypothetical protein D8S85_13935 [Butyricimonas faecalis]|jgi:hypothetical protein|uniref:Uncharacterized protein n=2 Tax=Butyricimonas faecalis TaxID=2093856 RepID=A0A3Q9IPZ8_9BACT|nr:hypothetical protein D8S85_13935 [Butyricimonas faecalis]